MRVSTARVARWSIKIPYKQIFLPAPLLQALSQILQLLDDKLQVELQLNAQYFYGSPAAFTELELW